MKFPLNSSQTIAVVAVTGALLGGAYALGRMGGNSEAKAPAVETVAAVDPQLAAPLPPPVQEDSKKPAPETKVAAAPAVKPAPMCNECARVTAVHMEERQGQASGIGVIGGAVLGGILGHQVGGGTGKKIATVGGAVAGGYAGNEVEKRSKSQHVWIVSLTNKDGSTQKHEQASDPQLRVGDVVVFRDGRLERR